MIIDKISVNTVVDFQRIKSERAQLTFLNNLRKPKPEKESDENNGGNYWVHSVSTISNVFTSENNKEILDKIDIIDEKHTKATAKISKVMFQRNINILYNFEDFDFSQLKPKFKLSYLSKPRRESVIQIQGIPVQVLPQHVFSYEEGGQIKIGAIWFVAKLDGYKISELAAFTDALYRFLNINYSRKYPISSLFCKSVDVTNLSSVNYDDIKNKMVPSILNSTLLSFKKLLH